MNDPTDVVAEIGMLRLVYAAACPTPRKWFDDSEQETPTQPSLMSGKLADMAVEIRYAHGQMLEDVQRHVKLAIAVGRVLYVRAEELSLSGEDDWDQLEQFLPEEFCSHYRTSPLIQALLKLGMVFAESDPDWSNERWEYLNHIMLRGFILGQRVAYPPRRLTHDFGADITEG